uniref:HAT C-terminal dimerisation domain-containing protein n=1 Tax=Amphimedon queenslandica TaxID=400682 RepID=A0A1X7TYF9_AMPQE
MEDGEGEVIISESSSDNESDEDSCSTEPAISSSPVASLLDRLKRPHLSDLARKRKRKVNQPRAPRKSTTARRSSSSSEPKSIKPADRVREYGNEPFKVSNAKLFCEGCREELNLKSTIINNHIRSKKHEQGKERLRKKRACEADIAEALSKSNEEEHLRGESLPEGTQVFRVKVAKCFLSAGVPLSKIECFRELLEETGYRLTDRRHMLDYVPFIQEQEISQVKKEIEGANVAVIFDGSTHVSEALAVVVRFVDHSWNIRQRLVRLQLLAKSLRGEEIAREIISVLSVSYSVKPHQLLAAMRDRAASNNVAMQTINIIYPYVIDIGCISHFLDRVGEYFKTVNLSEFMHLWISLFSHSIKAKLAWKMQTGKSMATYSTTRWWSKWEVMRQVMIYFGDIEPFLQNNDFAPAIRSKLLAFMSDSNKKALLQVELAATIDWGEPFVKACYALEGDGLLVLSCYERINVIISTIEVNHTPSLSATVSQICSAATDGAAAQLQLMQYAKSCVQGGIDYFHNHLATTFKSIMAIFKAARYFSPQMICSLKPHASDLNQLACISFINSQAIEELKSELPKYMARAKDIDKEVCPLNWWKQNQDDLPVWSREAKKVFLLQPSSASVERVFSLLKSSFGDKQETALQDYIEASLMLQYNTR